MPTADPADADDAPLENSLQPGGLCWIPEPEGIGLCAREISNTSGKYLPKLRWPRRQDGLDLEHTSFDFWMLLFPNMLDNIVKWTNLNLPSRNKPVNKHEVVKFFGMQYAMTQYPTRQRQNYWSVEDTDLFPAPAFGQRFGMSQDRFTALVKYMKLYDPELDSADEPDPWRSVRTLIDGFN